MIVVDLSVKEYRDLGMFASAIWKLLWQRAVERRDVRRHPGRSFCSPTSAVFCKLNRSGFPGNGQVRSRKQRVHYAIVQRLPGGPGQPPFARGRAARNLATTVFCNNNCPVTNQWAADKIGQAYQMRVSTNIGLGGGGGASAGTQRTAVTSASHWNSRDWPKGGRSTAIRWRRCHRAWHALARAARTTSSRLQPERLTRDPIKELRYVTICWRSIRPLRPLEARRGLVPLAGMEAVSLSGHAPGSVAAFRVGIRYYRKRYLPFRRCFCRWSLGALG